MADAGECLTAATCPGVDTECWARTCVDTACSFTVADAGTALTAQAGGDCRLAACDGDGGIALLIDDNDTPGDEGNACTTEACAAGTPVHQNRPVDSPCPAGVCTAAGACVQCNASTQCPGGPDSECGARTCLANVCGLFLADAGTALATQAAGDCREAQCDGDGGTLSAALDTDFLDDGLQCTVESCSSGTPLSTPRVVDSPCTQSGFFCDGFGACVQCNAPSQCATASFCSTPTCLLNICGSNFAPNGVALPTQTAGDCKLAVCDGAGGTTTANEDGDLPVDGNDCTSDVCTMGVPSHTNLVVDTPCATGFCNGLAACVQCNSTPQCGVSSECVARACVSNACTVTYADAGTPLAAQAPGDCRQSQCDGDGGTLSAVFDTDLPADDTNQCTFELCSLGSPSTPNADAGFPCTQSGGTACNGLGVCVPAPAVTATNPADNTTPFANPSFSITFSQAMLPSTVTMQASDGPCTGTVQLSFDNFATCIGGTGPVFTAGNTVATFTTVPGMLVNRTHKLGVTTGATGSSGIPLGAQFSMANGFQLVTQPACEGSVVISQVYPAGGNANATYTHDFVELHNRGSTPVPLTGMSVQYASSTGTTWQSVALTGTIPPGGYYLIRLASQAAVGAPLPGTPDDIGNIPMGAASGRVALVNVATQLPNGSCPAANLLIDYVGWGASTTQCEGATGPQPPNTATWLARNLSGCEDYGVNASNFINNSTTPPRNTSSPTLYCACSVVNETDTPAEADYCVLQFPPSITGFAGNLTPLVYGRLFEAGMTEAAGAHVDVRAQLGFGPLTTNPQYQSGWTWVDATYNVQINNDDEYQASFTVPAIGTWRYGYRISRDQGTTWTYCDLDGAGSNPTLDFRLSQLGPLTSQ